MDQLTNLEIADVQNRWHEAGRPGLGSLGVDWWEVLTSPVQTAIKVGDAYGYGVQTGTKKFTPVPRDLSKPEPTDRVAVVPGTINTAYLYMPGHDPESVAENKQFVESRKNIFEAIAWPQSLTPGSVKSVNLMDEYYAALAAQQATGKAMSFAAESGDTRSGNAQQKRRPDDKTSEKKAGDWQQYVPWGVVGVLGLTVLIVALRR